MPGMFDPATMAQPVPTLDDIKGMLLQRSQMTLDGATAQDAAFQHQVAMRERARNLAAEPAYMRDEGATDFASRALSWDSFKELGADVKDAAGYAGSRLAAPIRIPQVMPADASPVSESRGIADRPAYFAGPSPATPEARDEMNADLAGSIAGGASDYWQLQGLAPWSMAGVMSKLPGALMDQELDAIDMQVGAGLDPLAANQADPSNRIGGNGDANLRFDRAKARPSLRIRGGQSQVMPEAGASEAATGEPDAAYMEAMEDVMRHLAMGANRY